jgi:hypothetical protein
MSIDLETATSQHVALFARELTAADDIEAQANGWFSAAAAFEELRAQSIEAWAAVFEGRVGCMLGVRHRPGGEWQLWFHSTDFFAAYALAFLRPARRLFAALLERYPVLHGLIDSRNVGMVRLTTWLGFELGAVEQHGQLLFHPAVLRRPTHG